MSKVCIGIPVHAEPDRLLATLASVRANTGVEFQLLLLPDGPDGPTQNALLKLTDLPQLATVEARGGAACFNRLARYGDADLIVLLESGALVGPHWLDYLRSALDEDSRNGLTGPSTNRSWNEQAAFATAQPVPNDVSAASLELIRRFGTSVRTLEPLYSLGDFCYGVRREVFEAIGFADEGYGLGPCWEMDYNIRAARAGWRGVWACAAYVYRAPFTLRRQGDENRFFESSKRRYQDKFCGGRLRGEKSDYRLHCRGDACPNFAPANFVQTAQALPVLPLPAAPLPHPRPAILLTSSQEPLVSCIMPTCDRLEFVPEAVRAFLKQDYSDLELVIVDDGAQSVESVLPADPRLRLIRLPRKNNVGGKRNIACASARGEFIVHWDDDDWYPVDRVRRQITALRAARKEICGSSILFYYDVVEGRAWRYQYPGAIRRWVGGNTLAYRKSWWINHPFAEIQVGEDCRFVWNAPAAAICDLASPELCVSRIHRGNTSPKQLVGSYWQACAAAELQQLLGTEWSQFISVGTSTTPGSTAPLVSCIMPTFNRRPFVPLALESFRRQDYPAKELIVVDDGADPVRDLVEGAAGVRYLRLPARASIGEKRNLACAAAQGAIIAHWDDDDWYAPNRLRHQIAPLLSEQADLTGLENSYLLELPEVRFWLTRAGLHARMFTGDVHGGTLVYWKRLISEGLRYPAINLAEDAALIYAALRARKRLSRLPNRGVFVYVRHGRNAWQFQPGQFLDPTGWESTCPPPGFSADRLSAYREAAAASIAAAAG
jgi:glycosyltransferase involved in cell wall biosynthesis